MKPQRKKYVVVLAHSDGWGVLSANKVVEHIHKTYPHFGIYLIVSQASKNKAGKIATKLDDLKIPRELKETNMLAYFEHIDAIYDAMPSQQELMRRWEKIRQGDESELASLSSAENEKFCFDLGRDLARWQIAELSTFKKLAAKCCIDSTVRYTSRGGPVGGEEVAQMIGQLERQYGYGPEVLLSVDTMAILPADLLNRYCCISAHPGPLDDIRIEGMQSTLRSLAGQILYDADGVPLPTSHQFGWGLAYIKGTLFMQHPELDKGPPIRIVQTPVCPGMCAYQARDEIYAALTDTMLELLPVLLNKRERKVLLEKAVAEKEILDSKPHLSVAELEADQLAGWQGTAVGFADTSKPWGVEILQNLIIDPYYFRNQMRRFFPGSEREFEENYDRFFGNAVERLLKQADDRLEDPWARLYLGDADIIIQRRDPRTGEVIAEFRNSGPNG